MKKWKCSDADNIQQAMDNIADAPCSWTSTDIQDAIASLKRQKFADTYGHCVHSLSMVPERILVKLLEKWAQGDNSPMTSRPRGYAAGKSTTTPTPGGPRHPPRPHGFRSSTRCFRRTCTRSSTMTNYARPEGWEGGRPKTQLLDRHLPRN